MKNGRAIQQRLRAAWRRARRQPPHADQLLARQLRDLPVEDGQAEQSFRFIFITGAAGSGTTLLTRILSAPPEAVCLGGKYTTIPAEDETAARLAHFFNKAVTRLWDRAGSREQAARSRRMLPYLVTMMRSETGYEHRDRIVYKRSAPFNRGDRNRPDLSDLFAVFGDVRIVVIYRDPRAATYSSLRRGHVRRLRQASVICEEQLTYLSAQLNTLDPDTFRIISYERFCEQPLAGAGELARFCGLDEAAVRRAVVAAEVTAGKNQRWRSALSPADCHFLNTFFDSRRRGQWPLLDAAGALATRRQPVATSP